jgi:RimJ/RimL family protein N-acetyltransferase
MLPVVTTARLRLRRLTPDDAEFMLRLLNDPSYVRNIGDRGVRNTEDARHYIASGPVDSYDRHGFGLYLVELSSTGEPIGICGLLKRDSLPLPDLGFALLPSYWSRGYAFEAASAVVRHARKDHGLSHLLAITSPDNEASIALLTKLGFRDEGTTDWSGGEEVRLFALDA